MPTKKEAFLCSTCLELLLARSSLFYLVMACSASFHFLQATPSQNILICKFTMNQLHVDYITKCWEYCFTQTNNHKKFKILKFIYIFSTIFTCLQFNRRYITASILNFTRFYMGSVFTGSRHFFMVLSQV